MVINTDLEEILAKALEETRGPDGQVCPVNGSGDGRIMVTISSLTNVDANLAQ